MSCEPVIDLTAAQNQLLDDHLAKGEARHDGTFTKAYADPTYHHALKMLPHSEFEYDISQIERAAGIKLSTKQKEEKKREMVASRYINPICSWCHAKGTGVNLKKCSDCCLVWYCNKHCKKQHWKAFHSKWCCNLGAPVDPAHLYSVHCTQVPIAHAPAHCTVVDTVVNGKTAAVWGM